MLLSGTKAAPSKSKKSLAISRFARPLKGAFSTRGCDSECLERVFTPLIRNALKPRLRGRKEDGD